MQRSASQRDQADRFPLGRAIMIQAALCVLAWWVVAWLIAALVRATFSIFGDF